MLATQTVSAVPQLSSLYDSIIDSPSSEPTRQLHQRIVARRQPSSGAMNGQNPTLGGNGLTVKATYNYQAEDSSNLSFRRGDIIRVITRLDSGWWDGTLNGTRGWFPSNYCTIVTGQEATDRDAGSGDPETDFDFEEESDLTSGASEDESGSENGLRPRVSNDEAAAAWIPQATPDGRLFYCNTVTGDTRADLPLEAPLASDELSPWERGDVRIPTRSRPPPEMLAGGMERETSDGEYDDLTSASEQESGGRNGHGGSRKKRRGPTRNVRSANDSSASLVEDSLTRQRSHGSTYPSVEASNRNGPSDSSFISGPTSASAVGMANSFFDDGTGFSASWDMLIDNLREAVQEYRYAINTNDRVQFVQKAENISDHLRLLLAAGSGTTDNHSGQPSIIMTNRQLYPHFRVMMSEFSKLVLSSHLAAADWPPPGTHAKCLREADGLLSGTYAFIDVARTQRGEEIPRLVPGFVVGSNSGGNWQNNGLILRDTTSSLSDPEDYETSAEPNVPLTPQLITRLDDLKRMVLGCVRHLDEQLKIRDQMVNAARHEEITANVCSAATRIVESIGPYFHLIESINLAPLAGMFPNTNMTEFVSQKQRLYDLLADLVVNCQSVGGPLGDEWAAYRGESLEDRLANVRMSEQQLIACMHQLYLLLQFMCDQMPQGDPSLQYGEAKSPTASDYAGLSPHPASTPRVDHDHPRHRGSKVHQFFGESPDPVDEYPWFLKLDHGGENELVYMSNAPTVRGGTMLALVEQLTRHDRLDASFNSTFLLTYRSIISATELWDMLMRRFNTQPPNGLSQEQYKIWEQKKQKPIRHRVVNVVKMWIDQYWMEQADEISNGLIKSIHEFARSILYPTQEAMAKLIMGVCDARVAGKHDPFARRMMVNSTLPGPAPILPKNLRKLKFPDIDILEFARQLTILDYRFYSKITPKECMTKMWSAKEMGDSPEEAFPNIRAMILHSNQLTNWVGDMVLKQTSIKSRVVVIKSFVAIAEKCRQFHNYSTMTSIISTFSAAAIDRLKRTWSEVAPKTMSLLENMQRLMNATENFKNYKEVLQYTQAPCVPFFGVYLADMVQIHEGLSNELRGTSLINFYKRMRAADTVQGIQKFQMVQYRLTPVPELQEYICQNIQRAVDLTESYSRSLEVEPREDELARTTRQLSEYGGF